MPENKKQAVLIAGPTASGKSGVALSVAKQLDGIIINADAMQVYSCLRILTARPGAHEEAMAPHRLYGTVDCAERYSTGKWLLAVQNELAAAWAAGKLPILVGGTGLYFKALEEGLSAVPDIPADIRNRLEAVRQDDLYGQLCERDPTAAEAIKPLDRQRTIRALEVLEATGRPLSFWQSKQTPAPIDGASVVRIWLEVDRAEIYARCNERFESMVEIGALEEVKALLDRKLDPMLPAMKAIGVRELGDYLAGNSDLETAIAQSQMQTRRYAKRQMTWKRGQMDHWDTLAPDGVTARLLQKIAEN